MRSSSRQGFLVKFQDQISTPLRFDINCFSRMGTNRSKSEHPYCKILYPNSLCEHKYYDSCDALVSSDPYKWVPLYYGKVNALIWRNWKAFSNYYTKISRKMLGTTNISVLTKPLRIGKWEHTHHYVILFSLALSILSGTIWSLSCP